MLKHLDDNHATETVVREAWSLHESKAMYNNKMDKKANKRYFFHEILVLPHSLNLTVLQNEEELLTSLRDLRT